MNVPDDDEFKQSFNLNDKNQSLAGESEKKKCC